MTDKKLDTGGDNPKPSPKTSVEEKMNEILEEMNQMKKKLDALLKTSTSETTKGTGEKSQGKDPEKNPPEKKPEVTTTTRILNSENPAPTHGGEPKNFARNSAIGLTAAGAVLAGAPPSVIAQIPLIGKIPYLPQAAAAFQSGIQSVLSPLGLGTGINATNGLMYELWDVAGYATVGTLAVPAALWSIGMLKSVITRKKYGLGMGNILEGARTIVGAPSAAYDQIANLTDKATSVVKGTWNMATAPIRGTWNIGKNMVKGMWNGITKAASATTKPTWAGGVGAGLGTVVGVMGAPLTGGSSLIAAPLVGYAAGNIAKHSGILNPKTNT